MHGGTNVIKEEPLEGAKDENTDNDDSDED